jgi:hypothetical protein
LQAADAFWHLSNFLAPPVVLGAIAAIFTKVIWRRELARTTTGRLWRWATVASALASLAGLAAFGHDGRMATYAAMVVACAAALWWAGFHGAG